VATADALSKALADAERLRELTDIFKRCEADRMRESEQRLAAQQHQHNQQMGVLQQQIVGLEGALPSSMHAHDRVLGLRGMATWACAQEQVSRSVHNV
jgi:hypothetical protein